MYMKSIIIPYSVLFQRKAICIVTFCNSVEKQNLFANKFYANVISKKMTVSQKQYNFA